MDVPVLYSLAMSEKREKNIQLAHAVLDWNRTYLRHDASLTEAMVSQCFGEDFIVEPNGRHYQANPSNYLEFLNGMRASMAGIEYQIIHTVADDDAVAFDMAVQIAHTDGRQEHFIAMLLMRFDDKGKVALWKETYLPRV
ncbi:sulfatase maturation enzyme AslB (radical SAM superfamily) [Comamonas sp. 4034]